MGDLAARMVDAQVPGVAGRLRDLNRRPIGSRTGARAGGAWLDDTLAEYGLLHLLSRAWTRTDLPDDLRATVRNHIGFTVPKETVLATPPVADTWAVVGMRDSDEEQVSTRRVWLYGTTTGRYALVLFFAQRGMPLDASLVPGSGVTADLHFYPGGPAAARTGRRHPRRAPAGPVPGRRVHRRRGRRHVAARARRGPVARLVPDASSVAAPGSYPALVWPTRSGRLRTAGRRRDARPARAHRRPVRRPCSASSSPAGSCPPPCSRTTGWWSCDVRCPRVHRRRRHGPALEPASGRGAERVPAGPRRERPAGPRVRTARLGGSPGRGAARHPGVRSRRSRTEPAPDDSLPEPPAARGLAAGAAAGRRRGRDPVGERPRVRARARRSGSSRRPGCACRTGCSARLLPAGTCARPYVPCSVPAASGCSRSCRRPGSTGGRAAAAPSVAEVWETGTSEERLAWFRHARTVDPDGARAAAVAVWKESPAAFRTELMSAVAATA
jgi:hypothetical protein